MEDRRPFLSTIGLMLAASAAILLSLAAPFGLEPLGLPLPHALLVVTCLWAARFSAATPQLLIFALGLLFDLTRDGPVGAELLALLIVSEALRGSVERRPSDSVIVETVRFTLAAVIFEAIVWSLLALTYAPTPGVADLALRTAASAALYAVLAMSIGRFFGLAPGGGGRFGHLGAPPRRGRRKFSDGGRRHVRG